MEIEKNTKVNVPYRPDLGTGSVLQVAEAHGGEYEVDVVFETFFPYTRFYEINHKSKVTYGG